MFEIGYNLRNILIEWSSKYIVFFSNNFQVRYHLLQDIF